MKYAENYERCCLEQPSRFQRWFMELLTRKARSIGQESHKIWPLKYLIDTFFPGRTGLRVLDCGAWNGWFLSYNTPAVAQRIALDFDGYYAQEMGERGIRFVLADLEKGALPLGDGSVDVVVMTSTLEHLGCPERIAPEMVRVLRPGGVVYITVPDIMKYGFRFWDDITHKRPYTRVSLRFLFETHGLTTELCGPYNHNFFVASQLFPERFRGFLMRFRGDALIYVGRKPGL